VLHAIADLLEWRGEGKANAYRRAATAIQLLPEPIALMAESGRLTEIPGVGPSIAAKVAELLATGQIAYLEELRCELPAGVRALLDVPGIKLRLAYQLHDRLGIQSAQELAEAVIAGRIREIPGLGPREEEAIRQGLARVLPGPSGHATPDGVHLKEPKG
jgi:DNA polymerase (family 10)